MVAGEVVGGVFLTRDELFGVEELTVGVVADLIDDDGFKVDKESMVMRSVKFRNVAENKRKNCYAIREFP